MPIQLPPLAERFKRLLRFETAGVILELVVGIGPLVGDPLTADQHWAASVPREFVTRRIAHKVQPEQGGAFLRFTR